MVPDLRYRADLRSLAFLAVYTVLLCVLWFAEPSGPLQWALLASTCFFSWVASVIAHNSMHSPMFKQRWANRCVQVWMSFCYGFPVSEYVPAHNLSHHRYSQRREDVMRTTRMRFSWNLLNLLLFFPSVIPGVTRANLKFKQAMKGRIPAWHRQLFIENATIWTVYLGALIADWRKGLAYVVLPHVFALFGINVVNFLQHDGTDPDHPANHSRNFVGVWFNWLHLNNGFHGVHHDHPGLHWSLAPAVHAQKVAPLLHPALAQPSIGSYLWSAYVYPGRRLRYDGTPLQLPPKEPDLEWLDRPDATEGVV